MIYQVRYFYERWLNNLFSAQKCNIIFATNAIKHVNKSDFYRRREIVV